MLRSDHGGNPTNGGIKMENNNNNNNNDDNVNRWIELEKVCTDYDNAVAQLLATIEAL